MCGSPRPPSTAFYSVALRLTQRYTNGIVTEMTGEEFRNLRKTLRLTQVELAEKMGTTSNTVARWERGELQISELVSRFVQILTKLEKNKQRKPSAERKVPKK
ncbi:MAG: DUF1870 family protein [Acidobacteria bacterium]|nr:MAG: DUF1870 family protein [Acidobacteriota bacterium]